VPEPFAETEVALGDLRQREARLAGGQEVQRNREADPRLHRAGSRHREALHEDPVAARRGDEDRIAPLAHDRLVRRARLGAAGERGLALLAVDPQRDARDDRARRQRELGPRLRGLRGVVREHERPFQVPDGRARVHRAVEGRGREAQALPDLADLGPALLEVERLHAVREPLAHLGRRHRVERTAGGAEVDLPRLGRADAVRHQRGQAVRAHAAAHVAHAQQRLAAAQRAQQPQRALAVGRVSRGYARRRDARHQLGQVQRDEEQEAHRQPGQEGRDRVLRAPAETRREDERGNEREERGQRQEPDQDHGHGHADRRQREVEQRVEQADPGHGSSREDHLP
jgi:hypothetical protein